jgi:hypothetical protein
MQPARQAYEIYTIENALPDDELRDAVERFCEEALCKKPVHVELIRTGYPHSYVHLENVAFEISIFGESRKNSGSINRVTGIVSEYENANLPKRVGREFVRYVDDAATHPENGDWVPLHAELPSESLSKIDAFERAKLTMMFYGLPTDIGEYECLVNERDFGFKKNFEYTGAECFQKGFQINVSRVSGHVKRIHHYSIMDTPAPPESIIPKKKARVLATKFSKKETLINKFQYGPYSDGAVKWDYDVDLDDIEPVIATFGKDASFYFWRVPFQLNDTIYFRERSILVNMETGKVY